jgi:hypothetical protein
MRVSFDSNAWEKIFEPLDQNWVPVRSAIATGKISGFICESCFRIEAIPRAHRARYFAQPAIGVEFPMSIVMRDGQPHVHFMSIGPRDERHPGLPDAQSKKLRSALASGIRLMRAAAWLGLPSPSEIANMPFAQAEETNSEREQRRIYVSALIEKRGVGKALFDQIGGWNLDPGVPINEKKLSKACAEWADAELVAAHIAYQNDILCTNDWGLSAGNSIFDSRNRTWLSNEFGVRFVTLDELLGQICA